jgi:hypothetical protein
MANLPLRNLGTIGVISDIGPHYLPPNAFTKAVNVIFDEDRVQRAPVFKQMYPAVKSSLAWDSAGTSWGSQAGTWETVTGGDTANSRFAGSYADPLYGESVFVCDNDGSVRTYANGSMVVATPGSGLITSNEPWSHAQVAGLSYLARKGMRPYVRNIKTDAAYSLIAGDWDTTHTARVVRGYLDYVIMLGITKGTTEYPTMVKWSNPVEYGSVVTAVAWDPTNPGFVAGENVIPEMTTGLVDGLPLGTNFILYSNDQVWLMEYTGSSLVFNYRRLFPTGGVFNTNCVVEVEGKHFVFGEDDIYIHDGVSRQSIADKRVRRNIFNSLDRDKRNAAFVLHDPISNLVYFCFATVDTSVAWPGTQFCNRAAIYNYRSDTWSFMDMPNVVGGGQVTYASATGDQKVSMVLGATDTANSLTESRVYALDLPAAPVVNAGVTAEALKPAIVERTGLDLDDPETGLPLRSYKTVKQLVPQVIADSPVTWEMGATDLPTGTPVYQAAVSFDPAVDYKVDTKASGRYLAYRLTSESPDNFALTGFDADVVSLSKR